MKKKKILILINYLSFFLSHRLSIAEALLNKGFEVFICYGELKGADPKILENKGFKVNFVPIQSGRINFFKDIKTLYHIWKIFCKVKPDLVHLITIKPYLYGGIISRIKKIPCLVSAVSGLGTLFVHHNFKSKFLRLLFYPIFKQAFNHSNQVVILQNNEDLNLLVDWNVLKKSKSRIIKGSGVDLKQFTYSKESDGIPMICFAGRLLKDKGIYDFILASKILEKRNVKARFCIAGDLDLNNPTGLKFNDIEKIKNETSIKILGFKKNISKLYANSHVVCLPSYREGLPKSLIDAAAAGRAIVTTDVAGCRDSIIPNKTGLLVPPKNPKKLADALQRLIENPQERVSMGLAARKFAEKEFPIERIVNQHIQIYDDLFNNYLNL